MSGVEVIAEVGSIEARGFSAAACGQLADVRGDARGLVAGQTDSSPSGATRRLCRHRGVRKCATCAWTADARNKKTGGFAREAVATQGR